MVDLSVYGKTSNIKLIWLKLTICDEIKTLDYLFLSIWKI